MSKERNKITRRKTSGVFRNFMLLFSSFLLCLVGVLTFYLLFEKIAELTDNMVFKIIFFMLMLILISNILSKILVKTIYLYEK